MIKKIALVLTALILVILPFLLGISIGKYSPYTEGNSFKTYVIIWTVISIAVASIVAVVAKYSDQSFGSLFIVGLWLFLLISPIAGIVGLAAAPDLSVKMLEHPEREHLRYIFLFIAAFLFGAFSFVLFKSNALKLRTVTRWILIGMFILAFAEFIWELAHHYLYPEALKEWISQGNNAEEFGKKYDNVTVINIVVLGRLIQFSLLIWLSMHFYKLRQLKLWSPVLIILFSSAGIVSALVIYATQMNIPKGFEILFLFFIPGMPFLLLYWLAVGLLTQFKKRERAG